MVEMKILGEKLSEARTQKKLSYRTLHKRTKIAVETNPNGIITWFANPLVVIY